MYICISNIFIRRSVNQAFVSHVLDYFTCTQDKPVALRFGREATRCVFFNTSMCNDNAEQYNLLDLSWQRRTCCCRMCTVERKDMNYVATVFGGNLRCGKDAQELITKSTPHWKKKLLRQPGTIIRSSNEDKEVQTVV